MSVYFQSPGRPLPNGRTFRPIRPAAVPSVVLATLVFVLTEIMYFCALISAYLVIRSHVFGSWTPPGDLRLPVAATALNTLVLMTSGVLMVLATKRYAR